MRQREIKVGAKVRIKKKIKNYKDSPWFAQAMDKYRGEKTTIARTDDGPNKLTLSIDTEWVWDYRWLTLIKEVKK